MGVGRDIANTLTLGGEDRDDSRLAYDRARRTARALHDRLDAGEYDPGVLSVSYDPLDTSDALRGYQTGPELRAQEENFLDPNEAAAAGLQAGPAMGGDGGSWWGGATSAYDGAESEFGGLEYDPTQLGAMNEAADYFAGVSKDGRDAIGDAAVARREAEAEALRRANVDAALAAEEARGTGSGAGRLLAELSGAQASTSDRYQAGLDAAAAASARRDAAQGTRAEIARSAGDARFNADAERARGMDAFASDRMAGQDAFAASRNTGLDSFAQERARQLDDWANHRYDDYYSVSERNADRRQETGEKNIERWWDTSDRNTELENKARTYNTIDRPATVLNNDMTVYGNEINTLQGQGSNYNSLGGQVGGNTKWAAEKIGAGVKAAAGGRPPEEDE